MTSRFLTALPVFNERSHVARVLDCVQRHSRHVLVVDDGSTDGTAELLAARGDIDVVRHEKNRGYGAALRSAFQFAIERNFDVLVTIDCDGQHEPQRITEFVERLDSVEQPPVDLVSGSRYLAAFPGDSSPPEERRRINVQITDEINTRLGLDLTDAFCGFKAYRVATLPQLDTTEDGYAMPLELWVQAAHAGLRIVEHPVPLVYLEEKRSFGGALDQGETRLDYYREVLDRTVRRLAARDAAPCCGESGR